MPLHSTMAYSSSSIFTLFNHFDDDYVVISPPYWIDQLKADRLPRNQWALFLCCVRWYTFFFTSHSLSLSFRIVNGRNILYPNVHITRAAHRTAVCRRLAPFSSGASFVFHKREIWMRSGDPALSVRLRGINENRVEDPSETARRSDCFQRLCHT